MQQIISCRIKESFRSENQEERQARLRALAAEYVRIMKDQIQQNVVGG